MKNLKIYAFGKCGEIDFVKDLPNWSGEIPQKGDVIILEFDEGKEKYKDLFRVLFRVIDETKKDCVEVYTRLQNSLV